MRIKSVRATPVRVPVTRKGVMARALRTHVSRTIVEIEADNGLVGVGETRGEWAAAIIGERFAPALAGLPAAERRTARDECLLPHIDYGFPELVMDQYAFAGVEMALWDLLGKETGLPLFRLLGGPVRERAPFVAYAYTVDPAEGRAPAEIPGLMAELAVRGIAETGAAMFEFKIGRHPVAVDIEVTRAIRRAVGEAIELTVDANMGYSLDEARRFLGGVREARLANIEEPVESLAECERLRAEFGVPVSTHCHHLDALKPYPLIDSVVIDLHHMGGIEATIEFMVRARALGRRVWLRSMWELGPSWAAMCHLGLARPELDRPGQCLINWIADDLVEGETWLVREGGVRPPERPGLGVALDREALGRYAVR